MAIRRGTAGMANSTTRGLSHRRRRRRAHAGRHRGLRGLRGLRRRRQTAAPSGRQQRSAEATGIGNWMTGGGIPGGNTTGGGGAGAGGGAAGAGAALRTTTRGGGAGGTISCTVAVAADGGRRRSGVRDRLGHLLRSGGRRTLYRGRRRRSARRHRHVARALIHGRLDNDRQCDGQCHHSRYEDGGQRAAH